MNCLSNSIDSALNYVLKVLHQKISNAPGRNYSVPKSTINTRAPPCIPQYAEFGREWEVETVCKTSNRLHGNMLAPLITNPTSILEITLKHAECKGGIRTRVVRIWRLAPRRASLTTRPRRRSGLPGPLQNRNRAYGPPIFRMAITFAKWSCTSETAPFTSFKLLVDTSDLTANANKSTTL